MINITLFLQVSNNSVAYDSAPHHVGVKAMFFNLSEIFLNYTITSAEMSSNSIITAAVVSQKFKVVTFCIIDL